MKRIYYLHLLSYGLSVREDVSEVPGAKDVPQGGGGQQPGGPAVVVHVGHGTDWILNTSYEARESYSGKKRNSV